jgi:hypothetical protein
MDVADQFEEIGVLLADDRFVTVLEEMARALVAEIEIDGIAGQEPAHEEGQTGPARTEQQMNVVGHQRPGEAFGAGLDEELREVEEESPVVGIVAEDVAAIDSADDHVLEQIGNIETGGSWHDGNIAAEEGLVN